MNDPVKALENLVRGTMNTCHICGRDIVSPVDPVCECEEEIASLRASNHSYTLQVAELESERNDLMHREHGASGQMADCHKILDRIGAPKSQDNGLSYNLNGRLSRLIRNETGKLWAAELNRVEDERDRYRESLENIERHMKESLGDGARFSTIHNIAADALGC